MRIIWDQQNKRFVAELAAGDQWRTDQMAVKDAKFKTTGAPDWIWWTNKALVLNKLKKIVGGPISITQEALEQFKKLDTKLQEKLGLQKQFKKAQKEAQKEAQKTVISESDYYLDEEIGVYCLKPRSLPVAIQEILDRSSEPRIERLKASTCLLCDEELYLPFDGGHTFCMFCEKETENKA